MKHYTGRMNALKNRARYLESRIEGLQQELDGMRWWQKLMFWNVDAIEHIIDLTLAEYWEVQRQLEHMEGMQRIDDAK